MENPTKKLKLALESLEVLSFEAVSPERRERGTVLGNDSVVREPSRLCPDTSECDVTMAPSYCPAYCPRVVTDLCL